MGVLTTEEIAAKLRRNRFTLPLTVLAVAFGGLGYGLAAMFVGKFLDSIFGGDERERALRSFYGLAGGLAIVGFLIVLFLINSPGWPTFLDDLVAISKSIFPIIDDHSEALTTAGYAERGMLVERSYALTLWLAIIASPLLLRQLPNIRRYIDLTARDKSSISSDPGMGLLGLLIILPLEVWLFFFGMEPKFGPISDFAGNTIYRNNGYLIFPELLLFLILFHAFFACALLRKVKQNRAGQS